MTSPNSLLSPFIPQGTTEHQMRVLAQYAQNGTMPPTDMILLLILVNFPLPLSWLPLQSRLDFYYYIVHLQLPFINALNSHPLISAILSIFWPIWLLVFFAFVYQLFKLLFALVIFFLPIITKMIIKRKTRIILELTFPINTNKSAYSTDQLFTLIHTLGRERTFIGGLLPIKRVYSLEIASNRKHGIKYYLTAPSQKDAQVIKRGLLAYLPGIQVQQVKDYLNENLLSNKNHVGGTELVLASNFAVPLKDLKVLSEHDPISYLVGNMTKIQEDDLLAFQIVAAPFMSYTHRSLENKINKLIKTISRGEPLSPILFPSLFQRIVSLPFISILWLLTKISFSALLFLLKIAASLLSTQNVGSVNYRGRQSSLGSYEKEIEKEVKSKIDQHLYETSIRVLIVTKDADEFNSRASGLLSSFGQFTTTYQAIEPKGRINIPIIRDLFTNLLISKFKYREISLPLWNTNPILSTSELSDIYHFPYAYTSKTEDMVKLHSKELPAPLSLKGNKSLYVVFGKNTYGGEETIIGLTEEERQTHMYILGRTGSGKTTLMFSMAKHDIEQGRGLAFIDPHGDVAEDLVASIPLNRKNDLIYVNPIDLKYPIGINVLELTPNLDEDEAELEKEVVAEGVISLFRKVFSKDENTNAHRIEYILRNTIYTAFTVKDCTLFTINKILTNPTFRKQAISQLKDQDLIDFWKYEFGKAGDYQVVKMTQGVTAKVGRFMRSPTAKRILEQPKSTINFDDIINQGKILICNFSQGKLGEDSSRVMGTTILTKLQQAALKRAYIPQNKRKSFYLYVDEFQNFATPSFTKMITEGRKYRMPLIIAEQSTSQQKDRDITNIILANATTVISFRSGNYVDEELMLNQFTPYIEKGAIMNLPRYRFYIKISAIESEEPFSGETIFIPVEKDTKKIEKLIEASRKNWAIVYQKKQEINDISNIEPKTGKGGLPSRKK